MGCGGSKSVVNKTSRERKQSILPPFIPDIKITGAENVSFLPSPAIKVIAIFGGPGSGKGHIVASLCSMFGVRLISMESLILHYLPKKVQHALSITTTKEMANLVKKDPANVPLDWVLRLIQNAIESEPDQFFVIDLLPNLRWLLRNDYLIKECSQEMKSFEEKVPISFAIHLSVKESSLEKTLDYSHHSCTLPAGATISDDADNSRAKRRYKLHETALTPFVEYFKSSNRLVTIDASSGATEQIWDKVHELFTDKQLSAWRPVDSVLVFATEGMTIGELDLTNCDMKVVVLQDIVSNPQTSPIEDLIDTLSHHIDTLADCTHYFVIDPAGTKIMDGNLDGFYRRAITFSDVRDTDEGCVNKVSCRLNALTGLSKPYFKAVCSSEDETLLFPSTSDEVFCQQLALCLAEKHPSKR